MKSRILVAAVAACGLAAPAVAHHDVPVLPDVFPRISTIVSPLAGAPAIVTDGSALRVEVDPGRAPSGLSNEGATLVPSFGAARVPVPLDRIAAEDEVASALWPGRTVHAATYSIPAFRDGFVEDLYDLHVAGDVQHRAVKVIDEYPSAPTFAVIADPSVGDPRPVQEGAEDLAATGSPDSLLDKTIKTTGNPMNEERWAALVKAIDEINLAQPDFVLVSGDLTFALYPRPVNWEYEDAHRILARLRVPAFLSPGNHDLYDFDYDDLDRPHTSDGKALWPLYFGPLYYSTDVGPNLHLVSLNTYDWADHEREPFDEGNNFSTRSGGQIAAEQMAWLEADLASYRARNAGGSIVTFAHHDPSWIQARHPWPGANRLETRDLFAAREVGAHFSGHTHEDRVARYHGGHVAETNGRRGTHGELHYVDRISGQVVPGWDQETLGAIIREPEHGPVFVSTTTVSSVLKGPDWGQGSYWGWRFGRLVPRGTGYDPADFGYPATRAFLDAFAERPERWRVSQAQYGVFSYPSYHLSAAADGPNDGTRDRVEVSVRNDLLVPMRLVIPFSLRAAGPVTVDGGTLLRARTAAGVTDAFAEVTVPAGAGVTVTASG